MRNAAEEELWASILVICPAGFMFIPASYPSRCMNTEIEMLRKGVSQPIGPEVISTTVSPATIEGIVAIALDCRTLTDATATLTSPGISPAVLRRTALPRLLGVL